jgi:hypothetical protein
MFLELLVDLKFPRHLEYQLYQIFQHYLEYQLFLVFPNLLDLATYSNSF